MARPPIPRWALPMKGPSQGAWVLYVICIGIAVHVIGYLFTGYWTVWNYLFLSLTVGAYLLLLGLTDYDDYRGAVKWMARRGFILRSVLVIFAILLIVGGVGATREGLQERRAKEKETAPTVSQGRLTP